MTDKMREWPMAPFFSLLNLDSGSLNPQPSYRHPDPDLWDLDWNLQD